MLVSLFLGGGAIAVAVVATFAIAAIIPSIIKPLFRLPFPFTVQLVLAIIVIFIIAALTILMYLIVIMMAISVF